MEDRYLIHFGCDPLGSPPTYGHRENHFIEEGILRAVGGINIGMKYIPIVTKEVLLSKVISFQPHIVHFSAHGTRSGGLVIENDRGKPTEFPKDKIVELFEIHKGRIECIVLTSCHSQALVNDLSRFIDNVFCLGGVVTSKNANRYVTAFYHAIAMGVSYQDAHKSAMLLL